jgi:hypothetical protein
MSQPSSPDLSSGQQPDSMADIRPGPPIPEQQWTLRLPLTLLPAGVCAAVFLLTYWLVPAAHIDKDRAWLLHGIVLAKGLVAYCIGYLLYWRLARPIKPSVAWGYSLSLCVSGAALGWLWSLQWVPVGSLVYFAGLFGLLLVARKDSMIAAV